MGRAGRWWSVGVGVAVACVVAGCGDELTRPGDTFDGWAPHDGSVTEVQDTTSDLTSTDGAIPQADAADTGSEAADSHDGESGEETSDVAPPGEVAEGADGTTPSDADSAELDDTFDSSNPPDDASPDDSTIDSWEVNIDSDSSGPLGGDDGGDATSDDTATGDTGPGPDNPCGFPPAVLPERYAPLMALDATALRAALFGLVSEQAVGLDYTAARDLMYGITDSIDVDADGQVTCIYTGLRQPTDGTRSPGSGTNEITTEHSWPRSDGAGAFPAEGDLHHLFPATSASNGRRGSYPFGDVACGLGWPRGCEWSQGGSALGPGVEGQARVFDVRFETRGDIARAHFYFAVRYQLPIPQEEEATLRRWHCDDPPSEAERLRNSRIETYQHNRNPFVDEPRLVEHLLDY